MAAGRGCVPIASMLLAIACSGGPPPGAVPSPRAATGEIDRDAPLPDPLPEVVARVNGQPIPLRNIRISAERAVKGGTDRRIAYREALQQAIDRELLAQEAMNRGLQPAPEHLEQAYDEARVDYKNDEGWVAILAASGLDPASFKAELRLKLMVDQLRAQEAQKVPAVSEAETRAYYDEHPEQFETGDRLEASHVFIRVPPGGEADRQAARNKAQAILARLKKGEDFAKVAREASDDPGSARIGGRLKPFSKGAMPEAFEAAAYALAPGATSDVVESKDGFHVIRLHARHPSQRRSWEEVGVPLRQALNQKRQQAAVDAFVAFLRSRARIETFI